MAVTARELPEWGDLNLVLDIALRLWRVRA
jgi:hypothetical protein